MIKLVLALFLSLTVTNALAQETVKFIPYTINQEDHTKFMNYLGEQPAKIAIPLMQALTALEQKAIEEAKKKEEKK